MGDMTPGLHRPCGVPTTAVAWSASLGAAVFLLLALGTQHPMVDGIDRSVTAYFSQPREPITTGLMRLVSFVFTPLLLLAYGGVIAFVLRRRREPDSGALLLGALIAAIVIENGTKLLVARPRPLGEVIFVIRFSYPSGHATVSTTFFTMLLCLFGPRIRSRRRRLVFGCAMIGTPLLVGFSRIYLVVHWLSDVVGGFALGIGIVSLAALVTNMAASKRSRSGHDRSRL